MHQNVSIEITSAGQQIMTYDILHVTIFFLAIAYVIAISAGCLCMRNYVRPRDYTVHAVEPENSLRPHSVPPFCWTDQSILLLLPGSCQVLHLHLEAYLCCSRRSGGFFPRADIPSCCWPRGCLSTRWHRLATHHLDRAW